MTVQEELQQHVLGSTVLIYYIMLRENKGYLKVHMFIVIFRLALI